MIPSGAATDGSDGVVDEAQSALEVNDGRMAPKSAAHTVVGDETVAAAGEHGFGRVSWEGSVPKRVEAAEVLPGVNACPGVVVDPTRCTGMPSKSSNEVSCG